MLTRLFAAASACLFLSACFASEVRLIGEGVQVHDGPIAICLEEDEPCLQTVFADGIYMVQPPPEDRDEQPIPLAFLPLIEDIDAPVWLGEFELSVQDEHLVAYIVARQKGTSEDGVALYEIAIPDCKDAAEGALEQYHLEQADSTTCRVTDIPAFIDYLIETHGQDYASADWWAQPR